MATGVVLCLPSPTSQQSPGTGVLQWLRRCRADHLATVPSVLQNLYDMPTNEGILALSKLKWVAFSGSTLKGSVGDGLAAAGIGISSIYGSTETGILSILRYPSPSRDWRYFTLRQDMGVRVKQLSCGTSQKNNDARCQFIVNVPGWIEPFHLQDDIRARGVHHGDYMVCGRLDDVIVLSHGQNVVPHAVEGALMNSTLVKSALAFGHARPELGALVVPSRPVPQESLPEFRSKLFKLVSDVCNNSRESIHYPEAIAVLPYTAEFPKTDKGTTKRQETWQLYAAEIEAVYKDITSCQAQ